MKHLKRRYVPRILRALRNDDGAASVEFVLSFPVIILATLIVFDVGRVVQESSTLSTAAREAARFGSARSDDNLLPATVADIEAEAARILLNAGDATITVTITPPATWVAGSTYIAGGTITVEITKPHTFFVTGWLSMTPIELRGRADMLIV